MKFLITGVSGFIGFHLAKRLLINGHEVHGIDSLTDYYDQNLKKQRSEILLEKKLSFFKEDINNLNSINSNYDFLIHLAAQPGVRLPKEMNYKYIESNLLGFSKINKLALVANIKNVIYASSSSVYGNATSPLAEDMPTEPHSIYGFTKKLNEDYAELLSLKNDIRILGLRFFTVYGPYGRPDMAYFKFSKMLKSNELIPLFNDGQTLRDMTYIKDIIDGIELSISYMLSKRENSYHEVFNLGNNKPISTSYLLKTISKKMNMRPNIDRIPGIKEVHTTNADLSKARKVLGYNPKINLDKGLDNFLEWFNEYEH
jgi:UDP-glucuronate 4-epimerase